MISLDNFVVQYTYTIDSVAPKTCLYKQFWHGSFTRGCGSPTSMNILIYVDIPDSMNELER